MTEMSKAETGRFIVQGPFTGKLDTIKEVEVLMSSNLVCDG